MNCLPFKKEKEHNQFWLRCGEKATLTHINWCSYYGKIVQRFLKNLKTITYDPATPLLGI